MTSPDDIYGKYRGGLPSTGGQWPEARGFGRTMLGNPWAQLAMVQLLAGAWKNAVEGWEVNRDLGDDGIDLTLAADSISKTIRYMRERLPEWASLEPITPDKDFDLPEYPGCEPFIKEYVEKVILKGNFDKGGVE